MTTRRLIQNPFLRVIWILHSNYYLHSLTNAVINKNLDKGKGSTSLGHILSF